MILICHGFLDSAKREQEDGMMAFQENYQTSQLVSETQNYWINASFTRLMWQSVSGTSTGKLAVTWML